LQGGQVGDYRPGGEASTDVTVWQPGAYNLEDCVEAGKQTARGVNL
jgi:hypothetical protein